MQTGKWEYQSDFAKKHYSEGVARGRAESIQTVLTARGIVIPDSVRERINDCNDLEQLDRWVEASASVTNAEELFDATPPSDAARKPPE